MTAVATGVPVAATQARSTFSKIWPAALGVLVAAGTAFGLTDGREVAAVVAASGFVYIAAAAIRRRGAAWPAFGVTFVLIALSKLTGLDAVTWLVAIAGAALVLGLARGR